MLFIITYVAVETLDVTPTESKEIDKRRTFLSYFGKDCSILNVEIMTNAGLLWNKHNNFSSLVLRRLKGTAQ